MNQTRVPQTPGETLSGLRLKAGRSLDEVAAATKIPLPMLQAIEQDEYHKISGELYVKSFLRSYAAEVGLEAEEILALYAGHTGTGAGAAPTPEGGTPVWQEDEIEIKRVGPPWVLIAVVAASVVVLVAIGYFLLRGGGEGADSGSENRPELQAPADSAMTETPPLDEGGSAAPETEQAGSAENVPASQPEPMPQSASLPQAVAGQSGELAIGGRTWPVVLRLVGPGPRQISVKKDGDRNYSQVNWPAQQRPLPGQGIQPGTAYHVREGVAIYWGAEDHFSLKVDDPADYRATINGQYRDISDLAAGVEMILNDPDVIKANLPGPPGGERP